MCFSQYYYVGRRKEDECKSNFGHLFKNKYSQGHHVQLLYLHGRSYKKISSALLGSRKFCQGREELTQRTVPACWTSRDSFSGLPCHREMWKWKQQAKFSVSFIIQKVQWSFQRALQSIINHGHWASNQFLWFYLQTELIIIGRNYHLSLYSSN